MLLLVEAEVAVVVVVSLLVVPLPAARFAREVSNGRLVVLERL